MKLPDFNLKNLVKDASNQIQNNFHRVVQVSESIFLLIFFLLHFSLLCAK